MHRLTFVTFLILALLAPRHSASATGNDAVANLGAFIARTLKAYEVPGAPVGLHSLEISSTVLGMTALRYCCASDFSSRATACARWRSIRTRDFLWPVKLQRVAQSSRGMTSSNSACSSLCRCRGLGR